MKHLLEEVRAIPGVIGACVYSAQQGLQGSNLPKIFKPERLAAVGKQLFKLHAAGRMSFADMTDISLHYDEAVLVVRELQADLLLIALCDPGCNQSLLTMSFNLLQEELRTGSYQLDDDAAEAAAERPNGAPVALDDRLQDLLDALKEKLGKVLGPMAGLIFEETVELWQKQGQSDFSTLPDLLELVEREIADDEKIAHYRRLIAPDLRDCVGR